MKTRRHHNNKGSLQIKRGKTYAQLKRIAKRLGLAYAMEKTPMTESTLDLELSRDRYQERADALLGALQHCVDGIKHARELGKFWSDDQRQVWLNGLESVARKAIAMATKA